MENAEIYYCNLSRKSDDKDVIKILSYINRINETSKSLPMKYEFFKKYWRSIHVNEFVNNYEIINLDFERLWDKYSKIETNPYSKLNDPKQKLIKRLISNHTEMTIGDVIKIRQRRITQKMYIKTVCDWKIIKFVK